jgi:hypothetical protein
MNNEITKAHCNQCLGSTNHNVLFKKETEWSVQASHDLVYGGSDSYQLLSCCGCERITFKHDSDCSEDFDTRGNPIVTTNYYPAEVSRKKPSWMNEMFCVLPLGNNFISDLIREIYIALENNSIRLAVMGIRALIEQVMINKVSDQGTFKKNMSKFESEGHISKNQRQVLEPVLEAGHATIHRSYSPTTEELIAMLDVTENIIESIYINEKRVKGITEKVFRKPRVKVT